MLSCKGRFFTDEYGRARLFRGFNYVDKSVKNGDKGVPAFHFDIPDESLSALADMGVNVIRLGVTWGAIEPEKGAFNFSYLDEVKAAVGKCRSFGIECYLDFHQDVYSPHLTTSGDGAPEFACVKPKGMKPRKTLIIWAEDYFLNPFVHKSFDRFWKAGSDVQTEFLTMLKTVASYLADCDILAYDVVNEPFPGSPALKVAASFGINGAKTLLKSPRVDRKKLLADIRSRDVFKILSVADDSRVMSGIVGPAQKIIKKFDREKYIPFLKKAEAALREAGYEGLIFAENCYFSNLGIPNGLSKISDKMAFAPHGYDVTVDTPLTNTASPYRVDFIFDEHKRAQDRMDVPVLVGEWGGMVPGADDYPALRHLVNKYNANYWSFTYWHWFRDMENSAIAETMTQTYPVAVAGVPENFEDIGGRFALSYTGDAKCGKPTEIFLAKPPVKVYSTAPYKIEGNRLFADPVDGGCVIIIET